MENDSYTLTGKSVRAISKTIARVKRMAKAKETQAGIDEPIGSGWNTRIAKLKTTLSAGGTAEADWYAGEDDPVDTGEDLTISGYWLEDGASIAADTQCVVVFAGGAWHPVVGGSGGSRIQRGVLDGDLVGSASATVSVWSNASTDSGDNETVYCWLLGSGETITAGTRVFFAPVDSRFEVIAAACDGESGPSLAGSSPIVVSGDLNSSGGATVSHANSGVTAGSYGGSGNLMSATVNATGHVTALSNVALAASSPIVLSGSTYSHANSGVTAAAYGGSGKLLAATFDATGHATSASEVSLAATSPIVLSGSTYSHATSGVTADTYGEATKVPQITVNATGHITAVTEVDISGGGGSTTHCAVVQLSADFEESNSTATATYLFGLIGTTPGPVAGDSIAVNNPRKGTSFTRYIWRAKKYNFAEVFYNGTSWEFAYPREEYRLYDGASFGLLDATTSTGSGGNCFLEWNGVNRYLSNGSASLSSSTQTDLSVTGFSSRSSKYLSLETPGIDTGASGWTWGCRVYLDSSQPTGGGGGVWNPLFSLSDNSGGSTGLVVAYNNSTGQVTFWGTSCSAVTLLTGSWYDVVVRRSGSACTVWFNGVQVASGTTSTSMSDNLAFNIAKPFAAPSTDSSYTNGTFSKCFFVNRAWADDEIWYRSATNSVQTPGPYNGNQLLDKAGSTTTVPVIFGDSVGRCHLVGESTIDLSAMQGPQGSWAAVTSPTSSAVTSLAITFNKPAYGVSISSFTLTRDGGANLLTAESITASSDFTTYTLNGLSSLTTTSGAYVLTCTGSGIKDFNAAPMTSAATRSWTKIAGWSLISSNFQFGYPFNDGIAGAPAITRGWDSSGVLSSSTDLTIAGTTALATVGGRRCALFSSTSKSLYKSTVPGSWSANTDFTIAFWMQKTTSTDSGQFYPISFNDYASGTSEGVWLTPTVSSADITIDYNSGTFYPWLRSSTTPAVSTPNDTNWRHWVFVRSAGGATHKYYRDGVLLGTHSSGTYNYGTLSGPLLIGGWTGASAYTSATRGGIASLLVWSRALSDSDVTTLYNSGSTLQPTT